MSIVILLCLFIVVELIVVPVVTPDLLQRHVATLVSTNDYVVALCNFWVAYAFVELGFGRVSLWSNKAHPSFVPSTPYCFAIDAIIRDESSILPSVHGRCFRI